MNFDVLKELVPGCVIATRTEQIVPHYKNVRLIEALGAIKEPHEIVARLQRSSGFSPEQRQETAAVRHHMIEGIKFHFFPQAQHVGLATSIDTLIRYGYVGKDIGTIARFKLCEAADKIDLKKDGAQPSFGQALDSHMVDALIAHTGAGKTVSLDLIARSYDHVIYHPETGFFQIPVLMVEMPQKDSFKQLLLAIGNAIGEKLPNQNYDIDISDKDTVHVLLRKVAKLLVNFSVGIVIIDEIQKLGSDRNNIHQVMKDILTLCNTTRTPFLFAGTNAATRILWGDSALARRTAGIPLWERFNPIVRPYQCHEFLAALWENQWLRNPVPLTPDLEALMIELSQGIADSMVLIFKFAQQNALTLGEETLTADLLRNAYAKNLTAFHPALTALRTGDWTALGELRDVAPVSVGEIALLTRSAVATATKTGGTFSAKTSGEDALGRIAASLAGVGVDEAEALKVAKAVLASGEVTTLMEALDKGIKKVRKGGKKTEETVETFADRPDDYRRSIYLAEIEGTTVMEQLVKAGHVRPVTDYFSF
jgi:hypothetical protein